METYLITWRPWTFANVFLMCLLSIFIFYTLARLGKMGKDAMSGGS